MSSIQAYKAHKQEGTLVSKVHKQGALDRHIFPSASLHQWLLCMSNEEYLRNPRRFYSISLVATEANSLAGASGKGICLQSHTHWYKPQKCCINSWA